jgi:hypothetical protein
MNLKEFMRALKGDIAGSDFAIGDSFWLDGVEFEVKNKKR